MDISERILKTISKIAKDKNTPEDGVTWNEIAIEQAVELNVLFDLMDISGGLPTKEKMISGLKKYTNCAMPENEKDLLHRERIAGYNQAIGEIINLCKDGEYLKEGDVAYIEHTDEWVCVLNISCGYFTGHILNDKTLDTYNYALIDIDNIYRERK